MNRHPNKAIVVLALSIGCISSSMTSTSEAQQLVGQQVNAAVNGAADSSSVAGSDSVNANVSTFAALGESRASSPHPAMEPMSSSQLISNTNVFSGAWDTASGSMGKIATAGVESYSYHLPSEAIVGSIPHSQDGSLKSGMRASTIVATSGVAMYPSPGEFPDSTKGSGVLSPPLDYPTQKLIFKTGLQPWDPNFDSTPQLIISYANVSTMPSSKKSGTRTAGNLLSGNSLLNDLNKNSLSGDLNSNAAPDLSPTLDSGSGSGLIPDPLAAQDNSVLGSNQPR